jgi:transposase-like protein
MSRSRLYPYKDAIAEALEAGTSIRALARTYDVGYSTMYRFLSRSLNHNPQLREREAAADLRRRRVEYAEGGPYYRSSLRRNARRSIALHGLDLDDYPNFKRLEDL